MTEAVNPVCEKRVLSHGARTDRVVVLIHGFTNCPQMWVKFAAGLHARGSNVLIPRLPRHGLADRLTDSPAHLTAAELKRCAEDAVLEAQGLGDRITVAGLSLGAVLAAHLATGSGAVDRCVMISPLFAAPGMPIPVSDALGFAAGRLLPNVFVWWDRRTKAGIRGPQHAYPRFATRGYGAMLEVGDEVRRAAARRRPRVADLRFVLNEADPAVNNVATEDLIATWRRQGTEVAVHTFGRELGLLHDLVDPDQLEQRTDVVYPVLERWITADVGLLP